MGFWDAHKKQVIAVAAAVLATGVIATAAVAVDGDSDKAPVVAGVQYEKPPVAPQTPETVGAPPEAPTTTAAQPDTDPAPARPQRPRQRRVTPGPTTTSVVRTGQDGYHIEASMRSTGSATTADLVTFAIAVTGNAGKVDNVTVDFGDGTSGTTPPPAAPSCSKDRGPSDANFEISHTYNRPGTFPVRIVAVEVACGERIAFDQQPVMVRISQGAVRSNGPDQPTSEDCILNPQSFCVHASGERRGQLNAVASDTDGYVNAVIIDWGHHQIEAVRYPMSECQIPADARWPASRRNVNVDHQFPESGTYRVTVTVVSSGCDGGDVQEATFAKDVAIS